MSAHVRFFRQRVPVHRLYNREGLNGGGFVLIRPNKKDEYIR
jgi:hypothetical protein